MIPMKNHLVLSTFIFTMISASFALEPGDKISIDAIRKAELVAGEIPETWKPGTLYIVECWATWCGPCKIAIPHLDQLHDTYADQGLAVIGMSVWEKKVASVKTYVERKGDGMSYPVAHAADKGAFQTDWLDAAGVGMIPHTFVLKDGIFLFQAHPTDLTEERVKTLLAGGEESDNLIAELQRVDRATAEMVLESGAFRNALTASNLEGMKQHLHAAEALRIESPLLESMRLEYALAAQDWAKVETHLKDPVPATLMTIVSRVEHAEDVPKNVLGKIVTELESIRMHGYTHAQIATLKWKSNDKKAALRSAQNALDTIKRTTFPPKPYEQFLAAMKAGKPMGLRELSRAMQAAAKARLKK